MIRNGDFYGLECPKSWCPLPMWQPVSAIVNGPPEVIVPSAILLIGTAPTGAFEGRANHFARYSMASARWEFCAPIVGQRVTPVNSDDCSILRYGPSGWVQLCGAQPGDQVSIVVNGVALAPASPGATRIIQVLRDGVPAGVVDVINSIVNVPACPSIPSFLTVNGTSFSPRLPGSTTDLLVQYAGDDVGLVDIINSIVTIPLAFVQAENSASTLIGPAIQAMPGTTVPVPIPDTIATLYDTALTELSSYLIPSTGLQQIIAPDASVRVLNSLNTVLDVALVRSGGAMDLFASDGSATGSNSLGTPHLSITVPAGASVPFLIPNIRIEHTDGYLDEVPYHPSPAMAYSCPPSSNPVVYFFDYSSTIDKPVDSSYKGRWVVCYGGGGGGSAGRSRAPIRFGGGGGGGGCIAMRWIPASDVLSTESFFVGAGGPGGVGNGQAGAPGGSTAFGLHVMARGGTGGPSDVVTPTAIGLSQLCNPPRSPNSISGAPPSKPGDTDFFDRNGVDGMFNNACPSGGGGGGSNSGAPTQDGMDGGGAWANSVLIAGVPGGVAGADGSDGQDNAVLFSFISPDIPIGTGTAGSGGGTGIGLAPAGKGGKGGLYGAGGGGGGGGHDGLMGKGGNGGQGCVLVVEVF